MISLDQARNQRLFLQALYGSSWLTSAHEVPVLDVAEEISVEIGQAIAIAEELQQRDLLALTASATPAYARVRLTPRGLHAAASGDSRRRRAS